MPCTPFQLPDGSRGIVCGRGPVQRCKCGRPATLLCDWKVPDKQTGTCDAPLCEACTTSPAPEKDLCAKHAREWEAMKAARALNHKKEDSNG